MLNIWKVWKPLFFSTVYFFILAYLLQFIHIYPKTGRFKCFTYFRQHFFFHFFDLCKDSHVIYKKILCLYLLLVNLSSRCVIILFIWRALTEEGTPVEILDMKGNRSSNSETNRSWFLYCMIDWLETQQCWGVSLKEVSPSVNVCCGITIQNVGNWNKERLFLESIYFEEHYRKLWSLFYTLYYIYWFC